jgi:Spy/CpxP family protein refolding chaperone
MTPGQAAIAWGLALTTLVAVASSTIAVWSMRSAASPSRDYHAWIHQELRLTEEQERNLLPSEMRYVEAKRHFTEVIRLANRELADAIGDDQTNSPRVQAAVERIHQAMGQMQKATLDHIFEMKAVLTAQQYERLIELTKEAFEHQGAKE